MQRDKLIMTYQWTHVQSGKTGYNEIEVLTANDGRNLIEHWNSIGYHPIYHWRYEIVTFLFKCKENERRKL